MAIITHEPAPAPFTPDPSERSNTSKRNRWIAAGVGGLAIGAMLWGGSKLGATTYTVENNLSSDKGTEAPAIPGETAGDTEAAPLDPATTDPEVFKNQPYELILESTVPVLEERRAESFGKINDRLIDRNAILSQEESVRTAQDIERNISADIYTITEISLTQPDFAKNLAHAVYEDEVSYNAFVESFNDKKHVVCSEAFAVSPEIPTTNGYIGNYLVEVPTLVILAGDLDRTTSSTDDSGADIPLVNRFVGKFTYDDGQTHYAVTYQLQQDNPNFIEYPENLVATNK